MFVDVTGQFDLLPVQDGIHMDSACAVRRKLRTSRRARPKMSRGDMDSDRVILRILVYRIMPWSILAPGPTLLNTGG